MFFIHAPASRLIQFNAKLYRYNGFDCIVVYNRFSHSTKNEVTTIGCILPKSWIVHQSKEHIYTEGINILGVHMYTKLKRRCMYYASPISSSKDWEPLGASVSYEKRNGVT